MSQREDKRIEWCNVCRDYTAHKVISGEWFTYHPQHKWNDLRRITCTCPRCKNEIRIITN